MGERKLKLIDVSRDTGIHRNTIRSLYQETALRIDLTVLETLCRYFDCGIGDLLELVDDQVSHEKRA
ncbi:MAG: hypothetical protein RLZZ602_2232 [Pseudomonadota bacterium]|jgi:putative transcriptional regulator